MLPNKNKGFCQKIPLKIISKFFKYIKCLIVKCGHKWGSEGVLFESLTKIVNCRFLLVIFAQIWEACINFFPKKYKIW